MAEPTAVTLNTPSSSSMTNSAAEKDVEKGSLTPDGASSTQRHPSEADSESQSPISLSKQEKQSYIVEWEVGDKENPFTWSLKRKWFATIVLNIGPLFVNIGTSVLSGSAKAIGKEYHQSTEITVLITSMFLMGFTFGPLIFGPLSERIGRKIPVVLGVTLFATFCLPIALARNFYTILISRFFSGLFGSASMATTGGMVADIWPDAATRGVGMDIFIMTGFLGPILGPIIGNFVTQSYLGWRWTMWITAIISYSYIIFMFLTVPETYAPVLLTRKAAKLRLKTKNWALHSKVEESETDFKSFAKAFLVRPWLLLCTEPIYLVITIYMAFVYGVLFLFFEGFPIAFQEVRGWKPQIAALPFLGLAIGVAFAVVFIIYDTLTSFKRAVQAAAAAGRRFEPETRLPPMVVGALILPAGCFWAAWTSQASTPWPAQCVAYIFVGGSLFIIFVQGFKYIVDVYLNVANSAISGNTFLRSFFGAGFPLFSTGMYHNLGVPWATSLLGFISFALAPVPVLFYIYGKKLRSLSKNALVDA